MSLSLQCPQCHSVFCLLQRWHQSLTLHPMIQLLPWSCVSRGFPLWGPGSVIWTTRTWLAGSQHSRALTEKQKSEENNFLLSPSDHWEFSYGDYLILQTGQCQSHVHKGKSKCLIETLVFNAMHNVHILVPILSASCIEKNLSNTFWSVMSGSSSSNKACQFLDYFGCHSTHEWIESL